MERLIGRMPILILCFLCDGLVAVEGQSDAEDLIEFVLAAHRRNRDALKSGYAHGEYVFKRVAVPGSPDDPAKEHGRIEKRKFTWYLAGDQRRVDQVSLPLENGAVRFGVATDRKSAWSNMHHIYVRKWGNDVVDAYIGKPVDPSTAFVRGIRVHFDPLIFFNVNDDSLEGRVRSWRQSEAKITVATERGVGHKIYALIAESEKHGYKWRTEVRIAADQGFNVVQLKSFRSDLDEPLEEFTASYTDGGTNGRCFFPARYILKAHMVDMDEYVDVTFREVVLNKPVDPKVFTFEGMQVPPGSSLYDMRLGKPIRLYYGGLPARELDAMVNRVLAERMSDMRETAREAGTDGRPAIARGSKRTPEAPANPPVAAQTRGMGLWLLVGASFVLALVVSVYVIRMRRRQPREC